MKHVFPVLLICCIVLFGSTSETPRGSEEGTKVPLDTGTSKRSQADSNPAASSCCGCHEEEGPKIRHESVGQYLAEEGETWHRMLDFLRWQFSVYGITCSEKGHNLSGSYDVRVGTTFGGAGIVDPLATRAAAIKLKELLDEKFHERNRRLVRACIADCLTYLQKGNRGDRGRIYQAENEVLCFSAYSAARPEILPGQPGGGISISALKSYLTRPVAGGYTLR